MPGPVCYGRGGVLPTVTDANAILGRVDPGRLPGVQRGAAFGETERAIDNHIGAPLGLDIEDAAAAILAVASNQLASAIRLVSVEKGYDPRDFALFPFGGAGALHAVELARELGMPTVLVPRFPGHHLGTGLRDRGSSSRFRAHDVQATAGGRSRLSPTTCWRSRRASGWRRSRLKACRFRALRSCMKPTFSIAAKATFSACPCRPLALIGRRRSFARRTLQGALRHRARRNDARAGQPAHDGVRSKEGD